MIASSELQRLVEQGESQTVEFKKSLKLQREGLEALCAMVNSDLAHGRVFFGVEDDGSICGIEPGDVDGIQLKLTQKIKARFDPPLIVEIVSPKLNGKQVLILKAERIRGVPYHEYDGRAWIREGTAKRKLTLTEKQHLMRSRNRDSHPGPWQCDRCNAVVGLLASLSISNGKVKKSYRCGCGGEFWPAD